MLDLEWEKLEQNFQLNIVTFDEDIHQMRLKNSRFLGEYFSFQAHVTLNISYAFLSERVCRDNRLLRKYDINQ